MTIDIKIDKKELLIFSLFTVYIVFWIYLQLLHIPEEHILSDIFSNTYCFMAIIGGVYGLTISHKWGGLKSLLGRAIIAFSFGLLLQVFGQVVYTYMSDILLIDIPYPSIGDIGYFGSVIAYIYGSILFAKVCGITFTLKSLTNKAEAFLFPVIIIFYTYFVFLSDYIFDFSNILRIILDFGYPFGQSFYLSITLLTFFLTRKILGGKMRTKVMLIFFSLLIQYLADFNFLFQNSRGTWSYAGYGDLLYFIAYLFMALSIFQLNSVHSELKSKSVTKI